ncbi:MAG: hypothetical protein N2234_06390, partial [Planctomycetota bacterium]|nr:hypothetical protein [Planctomycetota bacterium]
VQDLLFAVPQSARKVLNDLHVSGSANFSLKVQGSRKGTNFSVNIFPRGRVKLKPKQFPVELSEVRGSILIDNKGLHIRRGRGKVGDGVVLLDRLFVPFEGSKDLSLELVVRAVKIDDSLFSVICERFGLDKKQWKLRGIVDGTLQLFVSGGAMKQFGHLRLQKFDFCFAEYPELRNGSGVLTLSPAGLRIEWARGEAAGGQACVWGEILQRGSKTDVRLRVDAYSLPLDSRVQGILPAPVKKIWDSFKPSGHTDLSCMIDGDVKDLKCQIRLFFKNVTATPQWFPYRTRGINGEVSIDILKEKILFSKIEAEGGKVFLEGYSLGVQGGRETSVEVTLEGLAYDERLEDALPKEVKGVLNSLSFNGVVSGRVRVRVEEIAKSSRTKFDLDLSVSNAVVSPGVKIEDFMGTVRLSGLIEDGRTVLSPLALDLRNLRVEGITIGRLSTALLLGDGSVKAERIEGEFYEGVLSGSCEIERKNEVTEVVLSLVAKNSSVKAAAESVFSKKMENATGRGSLYLTQLKITSAKEGTSIDGKGKIKFADANLWEVPFFSSLVKVLSLGQISVPFSKAGCEFTLDNRFVRFENVYFESSVVSLEGRGKLRYGGNLDFKFAVKLLPGVMKWIPPVAWVVDFIKDNMMQIKVRGTAKKPVIILRPFMPIADFFKGD